MLLFNFNNWQFWGEYNPSAGFYGEQKVAFDGPNRIIYINEGVTEIDVKQDLYSGWKEWMQGSQEEPVSASYLPAFTAIGGDPITDTQSLGVTYFLENGWRIQPYNSDVEYTLNVNGNLYTREAGQNPFKFAQGASINLSRSNLVDQITTNGGGGASAQDVWEYTTRTLTSGAAPSAAEVRAEIDSNSTQLATIVSDIATLPTAVEIRQEMDNNSTELSNIRTDISNLSSASDIANAVWSTLSANYINDSDTMGYLQNVPNIDVSGLSVSVDNAAIADAVWNKAIADMIVAGSAGERLKALLTLNKYLALD